MQIPFGMPTDPEVLSGGGGLYSTAHDYGRFLRMLLNGGELDGTRILSEETVRGLSEVHTGERRAGYIRTAMANLSGDFDLYPDMATGHGLATMVTPRWTYGEAIPRNQVPLVDIEDFGDTIVDQVREGGRVIAFFGQPAERDLVRLLAVVGFADTNSTCTDRPAPTADRP